MERYLKETDFIVSKTDLKGRITYGNCKFLEIAGFEEKELIGAPHNILRHPDVPRLIFRYLWEKIAKKEEVFAFVKNRCKNGDFYWVFANVTASVDSSGRVIGYYSVRRKANPEAIKIIEPLYKELVEAEKHSGIEGASKKLAQILEIKGMGYEEFVVSIQK